MDKDLTSSKEEVASHINAVMQLCSDRLREPHLEILSRNFATEVLSQTSKAAQHLVSVIESTADAVDAISKYSEKCGMNEPAGDDILISMHENHMERINAAMKLCKASGDLAETIRLNATDGMELLPQETKQQLGNVAQALCMLCYMLDIPFTDAIASNYRMTLHNKR